MIAVIQRKYDEIVYMYYYIHTSFGSVRLFDNSLPFLVFCSARSTRRRRGHAAHRRVDACIYMYACMHVCCLYRGKGDWRQLRVSVSVVHACMYVVCIGVRVTNVTSPIQHLTC